MVPCDAAGSGHLQQAQFVLRPGGRDLYAVLYRPVHVQARRAVVVCPPIFEEHCWTYPITRHVARALANAGVLVLRFDYFGTGDSMGTSEEFTASSATADIVHLCRWMTRQFPGVSVTTLGVRVGCIFLLRAMEQLASPDETSEPVRLEPPILWDPVLKPRTYVHTELRRTIGGAMVVYQKQVASREEILDETQRLGACERQGYKLSQIDGYPITSTLATEFSAVEDEPWTYSGEVSVIATLRAGSGQKEQAQLTPRLPNMAFHVVHEEPYWNQRPMYRQERVALLERTIQCLQLSE